MKPTGIPVHTLAASAYHVQAVAALPQPEYAQDIAIAVVVMNVPMAVPGARCAERAVT